MNKVISIQLASWSFPSDYYNYADDTAPFSTMPEGLNNFVQAVNKHSADYNLSINAAKTKIMQLDKMARKYEHCYIHHKC